MPDLATPPDFEAALRAELARLADAAPVPDDAHLDALEARAASLPAHRNRSRPRRHLALAAAVVLVLAGIVGAYIARQPTHRDGPTQLSSTGSTTSTTVVGPLLSARRLAAVAGSPIDDPAPGTVVMNGLTDQAALEKAWASSGLDSDRVPAVDFSSEVVVQIGIDDIGCPSSTLEFRLAPAAVRAAEVEPPSCPDPLAGATPRTFFYALRWSDTGRPFNLDVVPPDDPDSLGSSTID